MLAGTAPARSPTAKPAPAIRRGRLRVGCPIQRARDRAELKNLLEQGCDFNDMGVPRVTAAAEADRFWWQGWGQDWEVIAATRLDYSERGTMTPAPTRCC